MWEDESNKKGGRWILQAGKSAMIGSPGNEQPALDLYWLEVNCAEMLRWVVDFKPKFLSRL